MGQFGKFIPRPGQPERALTDPAGPVGKILQRVVAKGERYAKERTPVDTGRLRSSISGQVRSDDGLYGIIGTNVEYAPYVEFGARGRAPVGMLRGGAEQAVTEEL